MALSSGSIHNEDFISYQAAQGLAVTYPDRWSAFNDALTDKFLKESRLQRKTPFAPIAATYLAGGCLSQTICQIAYPNEKRIGGHWVNASFSKAVSWTRDTIYFNGNAFVNLTINADFTDSIQACSITGNHLFMISGKMNNAVNELDSYQYDSYIVDDVRFWHYQISGSTLTLIDDYYLYQPTVETKYSVQFLSNPYEFAAYKGADTLATIELIKFVVNPTTFTIDSETVITSFSGFQFDDGIDEIFNNNDGKTVVSVRNANIASLKVLQDSSLIDIDPLFYGNLPTTPCNLFFFVDIKNQVYIYQATTTPYNRLLFKGVEYDIDALAITDTDSRIINPISDCPYVNGDLFTYAFNGKFIVFCFKLFTMIINSESLTLDYKKFNYRFDAFKDVRPSTGTGSMIHFSPLSVK